MWLVTSIGFFSIVQKPEDRKSGELTVRARVRSDLERLRARFLPGMGPIEEDGGTDYRFRARAPKGEVAAALGNMAMELDYSNFKAEVAKRQGKHRAAVYGKVWSVLDPLRDAEAPASTRDSSQAATAGSPDGKPMAFGGLLIDDQQRVLLRRPTGDFDGYKWTFPKGRPGPGESAEQAALREVREETGYSAEITGRLSHCFAGGTTMTEYFLMAPKGQPGEFDEEETAEIKWATLADAEHLIAQTANAVGKKRDLAILDVLRKHLVG